ncbi:exonuclease [Streptomyces sp. P9(2023)]|uniref:exonuclease n=1 Tax=Streptomyces sp. P9(2023) TaxID=3064394 RepID=UPI0028F45EBC|nr:exonuclease [Streptomyces sp. P9(2023)]MDT9687370.1 exonuclease [Streptomyces sp. P9(2023)]
MAKAEFYVSADVEADGPVPGPFSMSSFGLAVAGAHDGSVFNACDPAERTFYAELKPIGDAYDPEALAVSGLDRDRLTREGQEPAQAMNAAAAWLAGVSDELAAVPVFVAYPLGYDWMWMYWYFMRFADAGSPFGHSRCMDVKTLYAAKASVPVNKATKRSMPRHLLSSRPHTHNALDDAIEQAELFQNLMTWEAGA